MNCKNIVLLDLFFWFVLEIYIRKWICIRYFFEIESSTCDAEWNGILKGRFLSELAHVTVLRAQQVYNTNSYLEDVIYFLDEINMQFQPSIKYAIVNSWNLILKMKVEMPSLKFFFFFSWERVSTYGSRIEPQTSYTTIRNFTSWANWNSCHL